jgi:transcriptional regulator with XRE-family HTH domain
MRLILSAAFLRDVRARGLTYAKLAQRADLDPATVSAAANGASVNMATATRLARAIRETPIVPGLAEWVGAQESRDRD